MNGGTLNVTTNQIDIGSQGSLAGAGGVGLITVSSGGGIGGTLSTTGTGGAFVGENVPGYLNVRGDGVTQSNVTLSAGTITNNQSNATGLRLGVNQQAVIGIVNLGAVGGGGTNNGRITTPSVNRGGAAGIL